MSRDSSVEPIPQNETELRDELFNGVVAVSTVAVDVGRPEQPNAVVEPQRLHARVAQARELTNLQHVHQMPYLRGRRFTPKTTITITRMTRSSGSPGRPNACCAGDGGIMAAPPPALMSSRPVRAGRPETPTKGRQPPTPPRQSRVEPETFRSDPRESR
jgi:hypothetical protein